jgi:tetratricopeptide (TPR) repeat protein
MEDFDMLWNYGDPAETEVKFREVLAVSADKDTPYLLQLQTQIARTYGLRDLFTEAHYLLDTVEKHLSKTPGIEHVRYHLERGRTFNSSGKKTEAKTHFELAQSIAEKLNDDYYAIDAMHMLVLVAPLDEGIVLSEEAIIKAQNSASEKARNWLGALYNNLGWNYFDTGQYEKSLSVFLRGVQAREEQKSERGIFLAKWLLEWCLDIWVELMMLLQFNWLCSKNPLLPAGPMVIYTKNWENFF